MSPPKVHSSCTLTLHLSSPGIGLIDPHSQSLFPLRYNIASVVYFYQNSRPRSTSRVSVAPAFNASIGRPLGTQPLPTRTALYPMAPMTSQRLPSRQFCNRPKRMRGFLALRNHSPQNCPLSSKILLLKSQRCICPNNWWRFWFDTKSESFGEIPTACHQISLKRSHQKIVSEQEISVLLGSLSTKRFTGKLTPK